jgi:hypothetical protein
MREDVPRGPIHPPQPPLQGLQESLVLYGSCGQEKRDNGGLRLVEKPCTMDDRTGDIRCVRGAQVGRGAVGFVRLGGLDSRAVLASGGGPAAAGPQPIPQPPAADDLQDESEVFVFYERRVRRRTQQ